MNAKTLFSPWHLLRAWARAVREQAQLRRDYPNGGRCHLCGDETAAGIKNCEECQVAMQGW